MMEPFEFILNDAGEVMLILGARMSEPSDAAISIDATNNVGYLERNALEEAIGLNLKDLDEEILEALSRCKTVAVLELSFEEHAEDTQIVYAYDAVLELRR